MSRIDFFISYHPAIRILIIILLSIVAHFIVRELRHLTQWTLARKGEEGTSTKEHLARSHPRLASLVTIFVSAVTFTIYFMAIGLILKEFNVSLTTYLASASVIGLAIGFGSQGLVQDVVTGLTLIFSEVLNIQDFVEISGQVGKVERIGLRFTTLVNLHGQRIYVPNRTIGIIGRFRKGYIRAYVDVQVTEKIDEKWVAAEIESIAGGMESQHKSIILAEPENLGIKTAGKGQWRYLRIKFRLWPGQGPLVEGPFKQRVISAMKIRDPDYSDWMVTVTYMTE
ncbi:mechanosensitive ion channel family protein [Thermodesulfobacteriota bacterium]